MEQALISTEVLRAVSAQHGTLDAVHDHVRNAGNQPLPHAAIAPAPAEAARNRLMEPLQPVPPQPAPVEPKAVPAVPQALASPQPLVHVVQVPQPQVHVIHAPQPQMQVLPAPVYAHPHYPAPVLAAPQQYQYHQTTFQSPLLTPPANAPPRFRAPPFNSPATLVL